MRDGVGILAPCDFYLALRNQGARQRRAHQIDAFVNRVRLDCCPDVIAHKFFAQVFDVKFRSAGRLCLFVQPVHLCSLAHVGAVADNFALVLLFQPAQHYRRVESAGVGENDFFDFAIDHFTFSIQFGVRWQAKRDTAFDCPVREGYNKAPSPLRSAGALQIIQTFPKSF